MASETMTMTPSETTGLAVGDHMQGESVIHTKSGASATCCQSAIGEQLEIRDARQQLVFRFDPQTGQATLNVPAGNLRLVCEQGDIELQAAGTIRTSSDQVEIRARKRMTFSVLDRLGQVFSRLLFDGGRTRLEAKTWEQQVDKLDVSAGESRMEAERIKVSAKEMHTQSSSIRTKADRKDEELGQRTSRVEGLDLHQAGRWKSIIRGLSLFRSKSVVMKSEDDFKIQGEHIHLG